MKPTLQLPTLLIGLAALFTGCEKKPEAAAPGPDAKRKVVIGFIGKSLSNDVFQAAQSGAVHAAKELGEKYGVDVEVEIRTPNDPGPSVARKPLRRKSKFLAIISVVSVDFAEMGRKTAEWILDTKSKTNEIEPTRFIARRSL